MNNSFKKIHDDEHSAVLIHPDGHKITIAKNGLSGTMKGALDKIPMHLAEGTPDEPIQEPSQSEMEQNAEKLMDNRSVETPVENAPYAFNPINAITPNSVLNIPKPENETEEPQREPAEAPVEQPQSKYTNMPMTQQQPQQNNMNAMGNVFAGSEKQLKGAIGEYKSGIKGEANEMAKQGEREQQVAQQQIDQATQTKARYDLEFDKLNQERQKWTDDLNNGHVDPNRYINDMSMGQKILTGIGIMFGGFNTNPNITRPNAAMDFLNKSIDHDIDSQKAELGKKENLLSANLRQFGNLRDAMDATRAMTADVYAAKIRQSTAQAMGPLAQARGEQLASQFEMNTAIPTMQSIAMRRAMMSGQNTGQTMNPAMTIQYMAPEKERPGLEKELQTMQNLRDARDKTLDTFDKMAKINTPLNRTLLNPVQSKKQLEALSEPLLGAMTKDTEGRVTPTDVKLMEPLFPSATDSANTLALKRKRLQEIVEKNSNFPGLEPYGITFPKSKPRPIQGGK